MLFICERCNSCALDWGRHYFTGMLSQLKKLTY
jgi:hypothetical protein